MSQIGTGKQCSSAELAKLLNGANGTCVIELGQAEIDKLCKSYERWGDLFLITLLVADKMTPPDVKELLAGKKNRVEFKPVTCQALVEGGWLVGCWTLIGRGTEIILQAGDGNSGALLGGFLGAAFAIGIGGTTIGDFKIWQR